MNSDSYVEGTPSSSTVVCTLWTLAKPIGERLPAERFAVCANLYSYAGINTILRAIAENPHWRQLVLFGADLTHAGDIVKAFFEKGIDNTGRVAGTSFVFQSEIPREVLAEIRSSVRFHDLRGQSVEVLNTRVASLDTLPAFAAPRTFPEPQPSPMESVDSEKVGFLVRGTTPSHAWLQILDLLLKFGEEKPTEYGTRMKELLNIQAVIEGDDPSFPECMPFSEKELEEYLPKLLAPEKPENVVYTYGSRLREGFDQISNAVEYLKRTPHTRRAIAFTWRISEDKSNTNPPCLTQLSWNISRGRLNQTCIFRSHDMYEGWPLNVLGLRRMQRKMSDDIGVDVGSLTCLSISAHMYEGKWSEAKDVVTKYDGFSAYRFDPDPRGNFVITTDPAKRTIAIQHFTPLGERTRFQWTNTLSDEKQALESLFSTLARSKLLSRQDHALYLGAELQKALTAMRAGKTYVQDKPLEWGETPPKGL